jgi:hypothetical protein
MGKVKVRMIASLAGPDESFQPGVEYEVDAKLAEAWCTLPAESPRAVYVEKPKAKARKPKREAAVRETRETAVEGAPEKR